MTSVVDDCAHHFLLPDGQSTLYDALPSFDEDLGGDVIAEELSLPPSIEAIDETQAGTGSSLPATPAERPCTFCPSSLPLPPASCPERATLVLDLDGTLIASEELNSANSAYLWNPHAAARAPDYEAMGRRVWLRPGVKEFLAAVRPHFEIVLFTAATQNWASAAVEQLDPSAELFDVMLHRDHTTSDLMWDYVKDLSRLGRDLARVVIVDDNPLMFMYQPDNALHVAAYEAAIAGGPDNVLERVSELLITQVAPAEDVREILGPMASAKTCILSTVAAHISGAPGGAATAAATVVASGASLEQPGTAAAVSMDTAARATTVAVDESAVPFCRNPEQSAALTDTSAMDAIDCDQACPSGDGVLRAADGGVANGAFDCDGDVDLAGEPSQPEGDSASDPQHQHQDQHAPQWQADADDQTVPCPAGEDRCGHTATAPVAAAPSEDCGGEWDADDADEGAAEAFDANGAAAHLGAEDGPACYRHRDWEEEAVQNTASDAEEGADAAPARLLGSDSEGGEQEESDAAPVDEQGEEATEHSSEDFEALMEDAIAEYDSDALDEPFNKDLMEYDGACPAATAATTARGLMGSYGATVGSCGDFGRPGSRHCGSYLEMVEGARYQCDSLADGFGEQQQQQQHQLVEGAHVADADAGCNESKQAPAAPMSFSLLDAKAEYVRAGGDGSPSLHVAVEGSRPAPPISADWSSSTLCELSSDPHTSGPEPTGNPPRGLLPSASGSDQQQLQSRQSSLPTGMVFLTDLNPALSCGCPAAAESDHAAPALCSGESGAAVVSQAAALAPALRSTGPLACKRPREDEWCGPVKVCERAQEVCETVVPVGEAVPPPQRRSRLEDGSSC